MRRRCRAGCSSVASGRPVLCRVAVVIVCEGVPVCRCTTKNQSSRSPHIAPLTRSLPLDGRSRRETGRHLEHADRRQVAAVAVLLRLLRRRRRGDRRELTVRAAHAARAPRRVAPAPARRARRERLGGEEVRRAARRAAAVAGRRRRRRAAAADCVAARELERLDERLKADRALLRLGSRRGCRGAGGWRRRSW